MFHVVFHFLHILQVIYMQALADCLLWLGKRELIFLLSFTCNSVVSVRSTFLFLLVLWDRLHYFIVAYSGPSI